VQGDLDAAVEYLTMQLSAGDDFGATATPPAAGGPDASLVGQLTDMGFSAEQAKVALELFVRTTHRTLDRHSVSAPASAYVVVVI
jgi:hypothetical protein